MLKNKTKTKATPRQFKTPSAAYNKVNATARAVMTNTLNEVGVTVEKFKDIVSDINREYVANGWPADCWPYSPQIDRLCVKLNQTYGTSMSCFHIWNIIVGMRKVGVLATIR